MAIFTQDYRYDLDFEYGKFHPFYEELKHLEKDNKINDRQKIDRAVLKANDLFKIFNVEKDNLKESGVKFKEVLNECDNLVKKISVPDDSTLQGIIKKDESAKWLVLFGERLGGYCAMSKVSSSQIRNAYGQVKKLELIVSIRPETEELDALSQRKLMLMIPRLAYAAKRQGAMNELSNVLTRAIKNTKTVGDFMRFSQFFEAILAYHKAFGGN